MRQEQKKTTKGGDTRSRKNRDLGGGVHRELVSCAYNYSLDEYKNLSTTLSNLRIADMGI
jgi:hypothetical protein